MILFLLRLSRHDVECAVLSKAPVTRLTLEDKYHPLFTAVGCVRLLELKRTDPRSFASLDNLTRKLTELKSDPEIVENLSAVKTVLEPYQYPACDIEETYGLVRLYGYTLPDVEDSKVIQKLVIAAVTNLNVKVRAIFPVQSLVLHSCQPNLQYIEREGGRRIVLQATRAIQAGEPLSVRWAGLGRG